MQVWKPWSVFVVLAALFSAACDGLPPTKHPQTRPPTQATKQTPTAVLPSFLDVLLQDEEVLVRHHARFEPPLDVEMAGLKGTVRFARRGLPVSLAAVATLKDASAGCEGSWNRIMDALHAHFSESSEREVVIGPSGLKTARWGPQDKQLEVRCLQSPSAGPEEQPGHQLTVARLYRRSSRPQPEPAGNPPKRPTSSPSSFVELLLDVEASEFLRWDEGRLHGRTVDLAGIPGRVMVEWTGTSGDSISVTVRPVPGELPACEPVWGRIVGRLSERLGVPRSPGSTALSPEGTLRAMWTGLSAECFPPSTSDGVARPASLSITRHHSPLKPARDVAEAGDPAQASRPPPAPGPTSGKTSASPEFGPPFLDVLLQDAAALSRLKGPLKVDLVGTKGTVRFVRTSERVFSVLAEPDHAPTTCADLWGPVMDALRKRRGEASILRITVPSSGRRSARLGPRHEPMIDVHCSDSSQAPPGRGGWPTEFKIVRHYRFTPEPEAAPSSKAPAPPPPESPSFVDPTGRPRGEDSRDRR